MTVKELFNRLNEALASRGWDKMSQADFTVMISEKEAAGEIKIVDGEVLTREKGV